MGSLLPKQALAYANGRLVGMSPKCCLWHLTAIIIIITIDITITIIANIITCIITVICIFVRTMVVITIAAVVAIIVVIGSILSHSVRGGQELIKHEQLKHH